MIRAPLIAIALAAIWLPGHALAQPTCTGTPNNGQLPCYPRAVNPQPTDIVLGTQQTGPQTANQTTTFTLQQLSDTILPNSLASPPPIGGTTPNTGAFSTLAVGGTGPITGFGTAIGQALGPLANFQGSGHPGLTLSDRLIFQRGSPTAADFADLQLNRSTAFTGGTTATQLNATLRVTTTVGANDKTQEYGIISQTVDNGTAGGLGYAAFLVSQRSASGSDFIAGANIGGVDLTAGPSSLNTAGGVIGAEIHAGGNQADDGGNTQTWGSHGLRKLIHLSGQHTVNDGLQAEISNGIWVDAVAANGSGHDNLLNFDSVIGFSVNTQARIALDTRGMIAPVGSTDPPFAVTMTAGHCIDFNGGASLISNPGGNTLCYDSGTGKLFFSVAGVHKWSIDASGNVKSAGTNTASTTP